MRTLNACVKTSASVCVEVSCQILGGMEYVSIAGFFSGDLEGRLSMIWIIFLLRTIFSDSAFSSAALYNFASFSPVWY